MWILKECSLVYATKIHGVFDSKDLAERYVSAYNEEARLQRAAKLVMYSIEEYPHNPEITHDA